MFQGTIATGLRICPTFVGIYPLQDVQLPRARYTPHRIMMYPTFLDTLAAFLGTLATRCVPISVPQRRYNSNT